MLSRAVACRKSFPLLRSGRKCWMTGARNYATNNHPSGWSTLTRKLLLLGVGTAVGADIVLFIKSRQDSEFKQWIDGYIPGWASMVDEVDQYNKSIMEWVNKKRKDLFGSGNSEKPVISTKPLPTLDKSSEPVINKTKERPIKSTPVKSGGDAVTDKKDLQPISKTTSDVEKNSRSQEEDSKQIVAEVKQPIVEPERPMVSQQKEEPPVDTKKDPVSISKDNVTAAKDSEKQHDPGEQHKPAKQQEPAEQQEPELKNIEPSLVKCLEEFAEACGTVIDLNLMLSKAMEKARSDVALVLLQPLPDHEKLAELEKTIEETTASLKAKIEESYFSYCGSHQMLLGLVKEATDAGLTSLVSQAQQCIFEHSVLIQSAEDSVRINQAVGDTFNSFINAVKSTESELAKELAALDAPAEVKPGLEETAVLVLAEQRVKLLYDKLKQLSLEEIVKSLENQKAELAKLYEERMQQAMDESHADMQQRIEAKLREVRKRHDIELLEQLRRQALTHNQHLKDSLEQKEAEMNEKWTEELQKKMAAQAEQYRLEMIAMYGKLAGIESTIDTVAKSSEEVRLRQSLHTASDNLFKALVTANQSVEADARHTFNKEIAGVKEVAGHDDMISELLTSIPEEAIKQGIYSKEVLKERFYRVKRICSRVSLVPLEGAGLGTYMISYFKSLLMLTMRNVPIDSDPSQLDTFQLLQLANAHLSSGDLEMAARIMNQLQGEAGQVAKDWISDVRIYLQTKQAITTLADYMSAAGLSLLK